MQSRYGLPKVSHTDRVDLLGSKHTEECAVNLNIGVLEAGSHTCMCTPVVHYGGWWSGCILIPFLMCVHGLCTSKKVERNSWELVWRTCGSLL